MASSLITSWQMDRERWKNKQILIFSASKITADGECSHKPKRCWLLGRKAMTNLKSVLESRDITWPTSKVRLVKAIIFPVVMYRCQSWTIKQAEHWRINTFKEWCLKRLLRVLWTVTRSNQSILNEINPERTDAEDEAPILWPPKVKNWLIRNYPDAWKGWRQKEKRRGRGVGAEDERVRYPHQLNGHELDQTPGDRLPSWLSQ